MPTNPTTLLLSSAVIAALVAAIVNGVFTTINGTITWKNLTRTMNHQADQTRLTAQAQVDQAHLAAARALRDAKRERLRESYATVIDAAYQMSNMTGLAVASFARLDTVDWGQSWEMTCQQIQPVLANARRYRTLLTLETEAAAFNAAFKEATKVFDEAVNLYSRGKRVMGDTQGAIEEGVLERHEELLKGIERMEGIARDHLAEFDRIL